MKQTQEKKEAEEVSAEAETKLESKIQQGFSKAETTSKEQVDEKSIKIEELTDTLKRLQAEFENYRKRIDKERTEFAKYANASFVEKCCRCLTASN